MRLLSGADGGLTALFVFLFVREALPGDALGVDRRWRSAVALTPLLGFISGAVTPDAMLYAVSAAIFYCLARAFRRGLTTALAIAIGVVIGDRLPDQAQLHRAGARRSLARAWSC